MISIVVPFLDAFDKLAPCLKALTKNAGSKDYEIILWDNGSKEPFEYNENALGVHIKYVRSAENIGVLPVFKEAYFEAEGDIILFIHSDVLIHGKNWVKRIQTAFKDDPKLGLLGFFGARGIGYDGGRSGSYSNMQGKIWGRCECHDLAAWHHGEQLSGTRPATVLDGLAMAFRDTTLRTLIYNTDMFAEWRAIHHFYDKVLSLKTIELGEHVAVIDIEFDHWSGATANHSTSYDKTARQWAKKHGHYINGEDGDRMVYLAAEKQMFGEYAQRLPVNVWNDYEYVWNGQ